MSTPVNPYAPSVWGAAQLVDLEVPSGQLCQVRKAGVQNLIAAGVIENVDVLTSMIDSKHLKRVSGKAKADAEKAGQLMPDGNVINAESLLQDPDNLVKVFELIDKVVVRMVVQPAVLPTPGEGTQRQSLERLAEQSAVYADMIDLVDKMYIFQYSVGGSTDLETFRERFQAGLGSMASI